MDLKRLNGQYFTMFNPFKHQAFYEFSALSGLPKSNILEPFAGSNNLISMLQEMGICNSFSSFDIKPCNPLVLQKDTLAYFPIGFPVCITNPPYLARNSAVRRGLTFNGGKYDDLYKFALEKCLANCEFVAAIIPASFLQSGLFRERLSAFILLNQQMFEDTEHPTCLALFTPLAKETQIYEGERFIGNLSELEKKLPDPIFGAPLKFNDPNGNLGLFAIDDTTSASIIFCEGTQISSDKIKHSSRSVTRINVETANLSKLIKNLNESFNVFRDETFDIFLTPFKGLRKDGKFRRRLDYALARKLICQTL